MKIHSAALEQKVTSHFQNLLEHRHQGLFRGNNKVPFVHDSLNYKEVNQSSVENF